MSALYPDVPLYPGVPAVFRLPGASTGGTVPELSQDALGGVPTGRVTWGIYDKGGALALDVDNIVSVEPRSEYRISDYPVENGGFRSYNKVALPEELRVTVSKGGSDSDRDAFLTAIDKMVASTDLYSIVTPDSAFRDFNLASRDYRRSSSGGVTLLTVELNFEEVRQTAASAFTASNATTATGNAPKAPSGANAVPLGPVQPATPTDAQTP